jgi:glutamine amidotransferase-like uncharacterized protein
MYAVAINPPHTLRRVLLIISISSLLVWFSACGTSDSTIGPPVAKNAQVSLTASVTPPVLLFNGTGTSSSDVSAVKTILNANKLNFATANSSQMNAMTEAKLRKYKLLIVPGGNSITIGKNLSATATKNIHNAVVNDGLHYLGICAGGFFGGYSIYNGLNLTSHVWFSFYADYYKGIHKESIFISYPSGTRLDQYWQDGPQFAGWGSVVGRYPNGSPAIVEGRSGAGWVMLSGVHPEAPTSWRGGMSFATTASADNAYAGTLIRAALNGTSLAHY